MQYADEHGFPTSHAALAQDYWSQMQPAMRTAIAKMFPLPPLKKFTMRAVNKRSLAHLRACHAFVAERMLDYHLTGNVLTATPKPTLPPSLIL